jgi:hypothetical protein
MGIVISGPSALGLGSKYFSLLFCAITVRQFTGSGKNATTGLILRPPKTSRMYFRASSKQASGLLLRSYSEG